MLRLTLLREEETEDGVFGRLSGEGVSTFFTMEDDWKDNQQGESCIPSGEYVLKRTIYHKHGYETFEVTDVPGRSRILIHPANTEEDVMGCIGLGLRRGKLIVDDEDNPGVRREKRAVVASREAFHRFMTALSDRDEALLTVRWAQGLPYKRR